MIAQGEQSGESERRGERRARTLKGAHIIFNGGYSSFDCTIRNITGAGAQLQFASTLGIPAHFELDLGPGETRRKCTARWRTEKAIGVSFDAD